MARQASAALILVVEGEDDHFIFDEHINKSDVLLIAGVGGKQNVLGAAERAEKHNVLGVRFLIDSDYDRWARPALKYPTNVVSSKGHDAIMDMVVSADALVDRVVGVHARAARRRGIVIDPPAIRRDAFRLAGALAPIRIVNDMNEYQLKLRDFPFGRVTEVGGDLSELARIAVDRSSTVLLAEHVTANATTVQQELDLSEAHYVGDHDLFGALARVLQSHGVTVKAATLWNTFLAGLLCAHLGVTDWYQDLVNWGERNSRRVFACPCAA
ncbi:hypothetical protein [Microbacterium sp. ZW T5_56]|uniref:hypothetical protein n=1 Tax=Microbacterium sp. ZW T5_56 TaxID=3378081 RepID=UPI003853DC19